MTTYKPKSPAEKATDELYDDTHFVEYTDEEKEYLEMFRAKRDEAKATVGPDGFKPAKNHRLPKTHTPGFLHPNYDPKKQGKVCVVCETQKGTPSFRRDYTREDTHADICAACCEKFDATEKRLKGRAKKHRLNDKQKAALKAVVKQRDANRRSMSKARSRKEMAVRELAQRRLAKDHLLPFIQRFNDKYDAGWVHRAICKRLEKFSRDVAEKKSPRLMIFMPPRGGKSEIASKNFPAWHLGKYPDHEIIASSYAVSLPMGFSRKVKDLILSEPFKQVFPHTRLNKNAQAAEAWLTTKGGGYVAAGVGTGITGKGAHVGIIDDPVKDAEEADSETQRQKVWDWYSSTFYTRLAPGGGVLVIQTRWHDDDLSGRLIRKQKEQEAELTEEIERITVEIAEAQEQVGAEALIAELKAELADLQYQYENMERWDILVFPQEATFDEYYHPGTDTFYDESDRGRVKIRAKGDVLHPARFNKRMVTRMKQTMEPRHWSALHQQNPVPEEGEIFTKSMFRYEPVVHDWRWSDVYIAGDLALGSRQHNDWSVLLVGAMDYEGQLHLLDMSRFKGGADPIIANTLALLKRYEKRIARFGLEQGQIQMAIYPELKRQIKAAKLAVPMAEGKNALKPVSDKVARSRVAQAMMQQGRIIVPSNQPWVEDFRMELLRFPGGLHDDCVDAVSWLARMTNKVEPPRRPSTTKIKSWKDKIAAHLRANEYGGGHLNA